MRKGNEPSASRLPVYRTAQPLVGRAFSGDCSRVFLEYEFIWNSFFIKTFQFHLFSSSHFLWTSSFYFLWDFVIFLLYLGTWIFIPIIPVSLLFKLIEMLIFNLLKRISNLVSWNENLLFWKNPILIKVQKIKRDVSEVRIRNFDKKKAPSFIVICGFV